MTAKLLLYPLTIIFFCAVLAQLINLNTTSFSGTNQIYLNDNKTDPLHSTFYDPTHESFTFGATPSETGYTVPAFSIIGIDGLLALIIGMLTLGTVLGIHFLGSGLSDSTINIIYKSVLFYAIWGIFSVFALGTGNIGILSIPMQMGTIMYIFLTLIYSIGIQQQINTHEG